MKLNLGCGFRKLEGFINCDNREEVKPDVCFDVLDGIPYPDDFFDHVMAIDFLEHIPIGKTIFVIEEIYRVLNPGGIFEHLTPSTDGRGAFQDPMHCSFWNINSFFYFMVDSYRELYGIKAKFEGENKDIITSNEMRIIHTHGVLRAVKQCI